MSVDWKLVCVRCGVDWPALELRYRCDCGGTLDVEHNFTGVRDTISLDLFDQRRASRDFLDRSGVWRFRELILPLSDETLRQVAVPRSEGNTHLYDAEAIARELGMDRLLLKHEGENPTASFKDRGMAVGMAVARQMGLHRVACASTGNTSASMASYAALAGLDAYVFVPQGKIATGKLSQAIAYGAHTLQIEGDFDDAMTLVEQVCQQAGIYLLNSINPFRIEGQKAIAFELLQDLGWQVPDWIVLPGGNLGNNTAIAKGLVELSELGLIDRLPRIAVVQATGANPLYTAFTANEELVPVQADTIASAIKIGNPVSWRKSLRGLQATRGTVTEVTDDEILDAKALVDSSGIGAEPASCATVAGLRRLLRGGVVKPTDSVCGVLTGHVLKDTDVVVDYHCGHIDGVTTDRANPPVVVEPTIEALLEQVRPGPARSTRGSG